MTESLRRFNDDIEHDDCHFAAVHRAAVAAIHAERLGETRIVKEIVDKVECPLCFVETLLSIAARLGDAQGIALAGQEALTSLLEESGWSEDPSYPGVGDLVRP